MLPFLKNQNEKSASIGVLVKNRNPDTDKTEENQDNSAAIEVCARALITAVHARDPKAVADAMSDAFEILDSRPHEEGPHIEPHSYEASKE